MRLEEEGTICLVAIIVFAMAYLAATVLAAILVMPALLSSSDKVEVYVLMGQSNMLGEGKIGPDNVNGSLGFAVKTEHKYPYLWNKTSNNWAVREDVRYVEVIGSGNASFEHSSLVHNEFMTVTGRTIGPELGIGNYVGRLSTQTLYLTLKPSNRLCCLFAWLCSRRQRHAKSSDDPQGLHRQQSFGMGSAPAWKPWLGIQRQQEHHLGIRCVPSVTGKMAKRHSSKAYQLDGGRTV